MMNKNKFKKIAALACTAALTGVLAFSLTACGDNNDNTGDGGDGTNTTQGALQLNKTSLTVKVGESDTVQVTSATTSGITWTSSDPTVATVKAGGNGGKVCTVTGVKEGTVTVTAKSGDYEITCSVTVTAAGDVGGGDDLGEPVDIPFDAGQPTGWSHWVSAESDISLSKMCVYEAGEKTEVHVTYSANGGPVDGLQLRLNNKYTGVLHDLSITIVSPVEAKIIVNGEIVELVKGENAVEVEGFSNQALYVQFGYGAQWDPNLVIGSNLEFVFKNIVITSNATEIAAPSFTYDAATETVAITDTNNSAKVGSYQLGFFESETATEPKTTVTVTDGGKVDLTAVSGGQYVVRIRAMGKDANVFNSDWSEGTQQITVAGSNVSITTTSTDGWYYWTEGSVGSVYKDGDGDIHINNLNASANSYSFQLQLNLTKAMTGIKMTVHAENSTQEAGAKSYIAFGQPAPVGSVQEKEVAYGEDVEINLTGLNITGTLVICFGNNISAWSGSSVSCLGGNITLSNIEITYAK